MKFFQKSLFISALYVLGFVGVAQAFDLYITEYPGVLIAQQSIYKVGAEYACDTPGFSGWRCQKVSYGSSGFEFLIRYNMAGQVPADHVMWLAGAAGGDVSRYLDGAATLQDQMSAQNVRSYDVSLVTVGVLYDGDGVTNDSYYAPPNTSAILSALAQYIKGQYAGGQKISLIAYDVGSNLAASGLAYRGLDSHVDQVFMMGGPAGVNYKRELSEPTFSAYLDPNEQFKGESVRSLVMWQNGWYGITTCDTYADFFSTKCCSLDHPTLCADTKLLDAASIFSDSDTPFNNVVNTYYPIKIHNILGEDTSPWFKTSSAYWLGQVTAVTETRDVVVGVGHELFSSSAVRGKVLTYLGLSDVSVDGGGSTLPGGADTVSPTAPTKIVLIDKTSSFGNLSPSSVEVLPSGATDNSMVVRYEIYRDGEYAGMATAGIPFKDYTIAPNTTYVYTAKAVDVSGNTSPVSSSFSITTSNAASSLSLTAPIPVMNDKPLILTTSVYQLESDGVFDKYTYDVLSCTDNQDGDIKASLVVTHSIPVNPTVGDSYLIQLDCADSDGNVAQPRTATVVIISPSAAVTTPPIITSTSPTTPPPAPLPVVPNAPGLNPGGLVPCGDDGQSSCQFCHFISLIDNVLQWLVKVMTLLATIAFVWAGVRMATSAGDAAAKQSAKKLIITAATGLVIILAAWIFIDFLLQVLVGSGFSGPWNLITCISQPVVTAGNP